MASFDQAQLQILGTLNETAEQLSSTSRKEDPIHPKIFNKSIPSPACNQQAS